MIKVSFCVFLINIRISCISVKLSGGSASPTNVDNPNGLEPDQEDKTFTCFSIVQVNNRRDSFLFLHYFQNYMLLDGKYHFF